MCVGQFAIAAIGSAGNLRPMTQHGEATPFDSIEDAIAAIAAGKPIVVADDEDRENEGDLVIAASKATPETINMMIRHARGLICVPMTDWQLRRLGLNPMVQQNRESMKTDFTVSVDAAAGISTGISASDRARTIQILANPDSTPDELVQPGHVFPLRARPGGVLERAGHTEAAVDLASLAGLYPAAVICEILNDDGSCSRLPDLIEFKKRHGLKLITIADLIEYRHQRERLVELIHQSPFASEYGDFELRVFRSSLDHAHHFVLSMGTLDGSPTLVRVHSENILTDVFAARHISGVNVLQTALQRIAKEGKGVVLYVSHPCGGLQLPKTSACAVNASPVVAKMDFRAYGLGAQILSALGLKQIRLLSSTSRKVVGLEGYGLEIVEQIPVLEMK
ncbi:MAG: 3,4-dihydroxy-2-butanone-4-phosphate synthase [Verrucomicrobiota bacterium]|nr:3,4-dihydroxy-2-butanone-4-phosphate synthase [Verrucomicrobiota bacterium]